MAENPFPTGDRSNATSY
jgi:hypothetical protein